MLDQNTEKLARLLWDYHHVRHTLEKADAILVLGSSDIRVAKYGAQLYLDGWAPLLIMSGGFGKLTKRLWNMTEADMFAQVAEDMGIPKEAILVENTSTNTGENILFTQALLKEQNIALKKVIIVQKPYMERRAYATFAKQWPEMEYIVTSPPVPFDEYPNDLLPLDKVIALMVGDLQRIREYPAQNFQIKQDIPKDVWEAYEELVRRGYTDYLI